MAYQALSGAGGRARPPAQGAKHLKLDLMMASGAGVRI